MYFTWVIFIVDHKYGLKIDIIWSLSPVAAILSIFERFVFFQFSTRPSPNHQCFIILINQNYYISNCIYRSVNITTSFLKQGECDSSFPTLDGSCNHPEDAGRSLKPYKERLKKFLRKDILSLPNYWLHGVQVSSAIK